jgi:hypothetical protein
LDLFSQIVRISSNLPARILTHDNQDASSPCISLPALSAQRSAYPAAQNQNPFSRLLYQKQASLLTRDVLPVPYQLILTSVFKATIEDDGKPWAVTESGAYLEISNGNETRTVYRNIKSENKDNRLITVYYSGFEVTGDPKTLSEDFYVNIQNAATREKGFHTFLEEFLHMELPLVRTTDGKELYINNIYKFMEIE